MRKDVPMVVITTLEEFEEAVSGAVDKALAKRPKRLHQSPGPDWVHQADSPLGSRVHCRVVTRRLAEKDPAARRVGQSRFLTKAAIEEEQQALGERSAKKFSTQSQPDNDVDHALLAKLRNLKGAR